MNKLTIIGNLTRDVELRTTQSGKSVANFTVAVNRRAKPGEKAEADFFGYPSGISKRKRAKSILPRDARCV